MIYFTEARLETLSIHRVGNKILDEKYKLSKAPVTIADDTLNDLLLQFFLTPFEKVNELYNFTHTSKQLTLNEIYAYSAEIFDNPDRFHEQSENIAKHLYNVSNHPKIKEGELYVASFSNVQLNGEVFNAIGIFKNENKATYLKVHADDEGFDLSYERDAINPKKLDKGCLIFNTDTDSGYKVAIVDNTNKTNEAVYWVDAFLNLAVINDAYTQTHATLSIYKDFVTEKLGEVYDITQAQKIDMLNRSMAYFKEKDAFDLNEFTTEVIGDEAGIESFKRYRDRYEQEFETEIPESFEINNAAVKKQQRIYKAVLKLDKNFHIYIHGNNELIEKGFDESKNLSYYKVYFKEEA